MKNILIVSSTTKIILQAIFGFVGLFFLGGFPLGMETYVVASSFIAVIIISWFMKEDKNVKN